MIDRDHRILRHATSSSSSSWWLRPWSPGIWSMRNMPLDAIPDLSDTQVIVYSRWDRSPDIMEDQVTYPIVTAMLGAPKVKDVRGFSDFGYSYVYIIFDEGTDIYWARSRTLEYLSSVLPRLPQGVKTELGPGRHRRRLGVSVRAGRYHRQAQPGRTAQLSGLVPALSPASRSRRGRGGAAGRIRAAVPGERRSATSCRRTTFRSCKVVEAVRSGNNDVGGRLVEFSGAEYMVRGRGYAKSTDDIGKIVLANSAERRADPRRATWATWRSAPISAAASRTGTATGDTVAGIVVMRQGENALEVIERVKAEAEGDRAGPAAGREDRHRLRPLRPDPALHRKPEAHADRRDRSSCRIVILIFLWHIPSAIIPDRHHSRSPSSSPSSP